VFFNVVFVYLLKLFFLLLLLLRVRVSAFSSVGELTRGGSLSLLSRERVIELLAIIPRSFFFKKIGSRLSFFSKEETLPLFFFFF